MKRVWAKSFVLDVSSVGLLAPRRISHILGRTKRDLHSFVKPSLLRR